MEEYGGFETKNQLIDYIKNAIALETDVSTQEMIISRYKIDNQSRKPQYNPYALPVAPVSNPPKVNNQNSKYCFGASSIPFFFAIILFASGIHNSQWGDDESGTFIASIVFALIGIGLIIAGIHSQKNNERIMQEYYQNVGKLNQLYQEKLKRIQNENANLQSDYQKNISLWENNDEENIKELNQHLKKTVTVRDAFYSLNHIYEKYRNLPALTSIYEYFVTGRCDSLTGPYGAYNMFEDEVRKDTVISQLNTVIDHLEQVKGNQYLLYQQVSMMQRNINSVVKELNEIKGFTASINRLSALNAYYSAVTAQNTTISATYHILNG